MSIGNYKQLSALFTPAEKTPAKIAFGNPPNPVLFEDARVVVYGVPFDDTATFGKGSQRGPEAIRHTSARQVETYCIDEGRDIYERTSVFDLGDFMISGRGNKRNLVQKIEKLGTLKEITSFIHAQGRIPLMLGGEHTLSYWPLSALAYEDPVVLHFDAHRDAKAEYEGMKMCHTTPMYHFLNENKNVREFVQIGIRQADAEEETFARERGIRTISVDDVRTNPKKVFDSINALTRNRNVYVTLDIDALDCCYTPCTGTPEPFGLRPEEIVNVLKSVNNKARLIGADCVEVAARGKDFREGTIATQILLRLLVQPCVQ